MKRSPILIMTLSALSLGSCSLFGPTGSSSSSSSKEATSEQTSETSSKQGTTSESQSPSSSPTTTSEESLPDIDYVKIFAPTTYSHVWAWVKQDGKDVNVFDCSWPGERMSTYDSDWNTYDFRDYQSLYVIVSHNGEYKSADYQIVSPGYWWYYQGSWYNEYPIAPTSSESESSEESSTSDTETSSYEPVPGELDNRHRTWYQLLVYSFADGNNDGIGDFKGIVNHLDYLKNLGIGGLWLSPIHPAASYHGYDVKDYKAVNSTYEVGGVTFAKLLEECHKRDIKVTLDMVLNHTSDQHPWYSQHRDWYSGETAFGGGMPDLNYDKSEVREAIKDIGKYWLGKGVDGFRCDAAAWIYGGGGSWTVESDKFAKTVAWWQEFSAEMKKVRSDVYMVGEVYTTLNWVEEFYASGMNAFNFSASYWPRTAMERGDSATWISEVVGHQSRVRAKDANGVEASFLSNHDTGRWARESDATEAIKLANALNAISPGGSYIYYGDELGMRGSSDGWEDMSYRTPMPFKTGKTNGNNYMGRNASTYTRSGKTADEDASDKSSIYSSLAAVINYKNANPSLYNAKVTQLSTGGNAVGAMEYAATEGKYTLLLNACDSEKTVTVTGDYEADFAMNSGSTSSSFSGKTVKLAPRSFAILTSEQSLTIQA